MNEQNYQTIIETLTEKLRAESYAAKYWSGQVDEAKKTIEKLEEKVADLEKRIDDLTF